jgi:hypothetical protein
MVFQQNHVEMSPSCNKAAEKVGGWQLGQSNNNFGCPAPVPPSEIRMAGVTTSQIEAVHDMHARLEKRVSCSRSEMSHIITFSEKY